MNAKPLKRARHVPPLLHLKLDMASDLSLQNQIRQKMIDAILLGAFPAGRRLPSSRELARHLHVARNTVVLAYQLLIAEGYLIARERSGLYVNEDVVKGRARFARVVIYVADLSRVLAPGIGLGFVVASSEVIAQARRIRALISRHPPLNNQRTAALFLSLGHYDSTMLRLGRVFRERLLALRDALNHYLPQSIAIAPVRGGTTYWVRGPAGLSIRGLARGVLVGPVDRYFATGVPTQPAFRLGVTGIPAGRIRAGIAILAEVVRELSAGPRIDLEAPGWLTPGELRRLMPGATLLCKTVYGEPCTIESSADGQLTGRAGYAYEDRDEGRWWIEEDRWCRQWTAWSYGEVARAGGGRLPCRSRRTIRGPAPDLRRERHPSDRR